MKDIKDKDVLPYNSKNEGINSVLTQISDKEIATESKEIIIKLSEENKNTEINKGIANVFCYIMNNNSSTTDIQKYSMLIAQALRIGYEEQYQKSEEEALTNYNNTRFDILELGQIWYKDLPDNYMYDSKYWSVILHDEFFNSFAKTYIKLLTSKSTKMANDILNLILSDTKKLDAKEEMALKVKLQLALIQTDNEYCEEKINKIEQNTMLDESVKTQVLSQLKALNYGTFSATSEDELKHLFTILFSSQENVNNLQIKLAGFDYEEIKNKLNEIPNLENDDKNETLNQLDKIKQGEFSYDALYAFNWAKRNGRDYNLGKSLDNVMKIIVQLNGYDLNKLSEDSNNKIN